MATMSITVTKSSPVVVKPSEPVKTGASATMKLSSFDMGLVKTTATALLVFEHPLHDAAETIKRALSQALVFYHPISGRIAAGVDDGGGDDEFHIRCTGEGMAFVAASADCALKEAKQLSDRRLLPGASRTTTTTTLLDLDLDELAVYYPAEGGGGCGPTDPLLLVQVTEFSCGGFVLGATWSHGIADGAGMAQFLQAVGELARGLSSPSVVPVRFDDALPSLPPSVAALEQLVTSLEPLDLACLAITVPSSSIQRVKARFREHSSNGESSCTTFEAVAAVLWQCRTRAVMSSTSTSPESLSLLSFPASVRAHVGAKDGYYGNCITQQLVVATSGAVASADAMDLIEMVRRAKEEIPRLLDDTNQLQGYGHLLRAIDDDLEQIGHLQYNALNVSSWRNLGFDKADFGAGAPAKVMCYGRPTQPLPFCVMSPPCGGDDGDVFCACVKEEHADAFLKEIARFT